MVGGLPASAAGVLRLLHKDNFRGLSNLEILELQNNNIGVLKSIDYQTQFSNVFRKSDVFSLLPNIRVLNLESNNMQTINISNFAGLSNLSRLDLGSNNIPESGLPSFSSLTNLTFLSLKNNRITSIKNSTFDGLSKLTHLNLELCRISAIESHAFEDLFTLQTLNLKSNALLGIPFALNIVLERKNRLHINLVDNSMVTNGLPPALVNYMNYVNNLNNIEKDVFLKISNTTNTSNIKNGLAFILDLGPCCADNTLTYLKLSSNTIWKENERSSCVSRDKVKIITVGSLNTSVICTELKKECYKEKFHYFNGERGLCVDKKKQCFDEFGRFGRFDAQDNNGNGVCVSLVSECAIKGPNYYFVNTTLQCNFNVSAAQISCTSKGESLDVNTQSCYRKEVEAVGQKIAIGVGVGGFVLLFIVIMVCVWFYRRKIKQKDLDLLDGLTPEQYVQQQGGNGEIKLVSDSQYQNSFNCQRNTSLLVSSNCSSITSSNYGNN
eukprot:Pgem_evm1s2566